MQVGAKRVQIMGCEGSQGGGTDGVGGQGTGGQGTGGKGTTIHNDGGERGTTDGGSSCTVM